MENGVFIIRYCSTEVSSDNHREKEKAKERERERQNLDFISSR